MPSYTLLAFHTRKQLELFLLYNTLRVAICNFPRSLQDFYFQNGVSFSRRMQNCNSKPQYSYQIQTRNSSKEASLHSNKNLSIGNCLHIQPELQNKTSFHEFCSRNYILFLSKQKPHPTMNHVRYGIMSIILTNLV